METNKGKLKEIKSFCKKYFKGFAAVISDYEFVSKLDIDLLSLEKIFIQSVNSIGRILSSSYIVQNDIQLNGSKQFGLKHLTCVQYISSILINVMDLPILFPKTVRLAAIRQIGKIVSRVGWLKDQKYQKIVYATAKNLQNRIQLSSNFSSDFDCAYLFALSHMAIDTQTQDILLKVIESCIPILTSNSNSNEQGDTYRNLNDIKISVCKAVQRLDQSPDRVYKIMKSLSEDQTAHPGVSSEASLALLCLSIKSGKRDIVKTITNGLKDLILSSERSTNIKSAIKMLYTICSNYPTQKNELLPILMEFIQSDSPYHRDYALYILSKLEIELNHKDYIPKIAEMIKNHFFVRIPEDVDPKSLNNNNFPLLKYVVKAACIVCSKYAEYAAILNEKINILIDSFSFSQILDIKISFTGEEITSALASVSSTVKSKPKKKKMKVSMPKKKKGKKSQEKEDKKDDDDDNDQNEEEEEEKNDENDDNENDDESNNDDINGDSDTNYIDPFDGYEPEQHEISPNSIAVFNWRRELAKTQKLLEFDIKVPEIGYAKTSSWVPQPKGFQIYEDVISHFVICCAYPDKPDITIQPFFSHLADTQRLVGRNPVTWEQISIILDKFSVSNYVQLFFALCFMQQLKQEGVAAKEYVDVEQEVLSELLCEMKIILELVEKLQQDKLAKRTQTGDTTIPSTRALRYSATLTG